MISCSFFPVTDEVWHLHWARWCCGWGAWLRDSCCSPIPGKEKQDARHGVDSGLAHLGSRWFRAGSSFANLARRFREAFAFFLVRFGEFCYLNLLLWSVCKISYCCLFLFVRIYDMLGCSLSWWYISLGILHAEPLLLQLSAYHALHGNHSLRLF